MGLEGIDNEAFDSGEKSANGGAPRHRGIALQIIDKNSALQTADVEGNQEEKPGCCKAFVEYFRPNKKLIPLKMHFFWHLMASAPIWQFYTLILKQRGISAQGIGVISSVMPVVNLVCGSILIGIIDYFKVHRISFVISKIVLPIMLSLIYWMPHIGPDSAGTLGADNVTFLGNASQLASAKGGTPGPVNVTFISNASQLAPPDGGGTPGAVHLNKTDRLFTNASRNIGKNFEIKDSNSNKTNSLLSHDLLLNHTNSTSQSLGKKGSKSGQDNSDLPLSQLMALTGFWIVIAIVFFEKLSSYVSSTMTDSVTFMILGDNSHLYGQQRLFGAVSWGLCALMTGALIDLYSANLPERDYLPSFILVAVFSVVDLVIVARLQVPQREKAASRPNLMGYLRVVSTPSNVLFFVTSIAIGISMYIVYTFHLLLVEEVANVWDPDFPALKTLQGLVVAVRAFGGEVPLFTFSGDIILKLGVTGTLIVVLACHTLRYLLYYIITNPWHYLPVEVLHGVNYSLFRSVISYNANAIAPEGTTATMLTVLKIALFIASSISGVTGGFMWDRFGGHATFLYLGLACLVYNVFFIVASYIIYRCCAKTQNTFRNLQNGYSLLRLRDRLQQ